MSIEEPVTRALGRVLRRAVVDHAASSSRGSGPSSLHVGIPGGVHRTLELDPTWDLDATLRVDMIEAITRRPLAEGRVPLLWLTRSGRSQTTSDDLLWAAAVRAAGGELRVALDLVVVTRHSWSDPVSGVGRTWRRHRTTSPSD